VIILAVTVVQQMGNEDDCSQYGLLTMSLCETPRTFFNGVLGGARDAMEVRVGCYKYEAGCWEPTFDISFLFAMTTLCSRATTMFLSAPNLKLSATTRESYC
jgi:hypothetical protein